MLGIKFGFGKKVESDYQELPQAPSPTSSEHHFGDATHFDANRQVSGISAYFSTDQKAKKVQAEAFKKLEKYLKNNNMPTLERARVYALSGKAEKCTVLALQTLLQNNEEELSEMISFGVGVSNPGACKSLLDLGLSVKICKEMGISFQGSKIPFDPIEKAIKSPSKDANYAKNIGALATRYFQELQDPAKVLEEKQRYATLLQSVEFITTAEKKAKALALQFFATPSSPKSKDV